ncbi:PREDICTED: zinc finger MYM-type protein 1-like [Prunus mume]|uniref:Zinc finger MYM-type protein 1-like n=1 Tax=Prunus mume TaxID=102107 RepID=A0ABM0NS86_PRUMU|nr:PREDICTED: zinc finger MYM-type protein 1-like [Prunus mume]
MERFFKRKSSSGSGSSDNVVSSNNVGTSRTPSSRQSQLDGGLGNLQSDPGLRTRMIDYDANMKDEFDEFDWLEYNISKDAAFCLYCYLFKTNFEQVGSEAFTGDEFKNWKKGRERFNMHVGPVGSVHNKAREAATNLMNQNTHIETAVSKHSDQARKAYRTCLNASIKCTKFLLRQGLAFRGHDESAISSNRGNYLELLQFLTYNNDKVREVVMENTPGNLKLLAPCIQKEIVNSCALETLDAIMDGLKDRFFSILGDEARDVSVKEQMTMVLRYVDDKGHVIERFVGIQHVTDTTSSSLKDAIDTFFSRNGLSLSKLRGQGYDGASNMRGELNDLKTKILREQPCAYYVHCFAHQLQLALVAVAKKNIDIASFFTTANSVINHVGASCKRRDLLREQLQEELVIAFENDCLITGRDLNQETSLKCAGDTRWNSHYDTLISIISMFSSVVHVLQMVIDDNPNESAGEANKLMREIRTFEFVFHLFLMKVILGLTNDLSQALQRKDQEIVNAMALVKSCKEKLHCMRNNGFDALVDEVSSFCYKHHIDVPNMEDAFILPGRSRRNAPIKTNHHHYRVELFIYVIDEQITELEDRFNESLKELLQKIILIVSRHDDLDDPEAPAAQPQPSATTIAAARNLDWAKIVVVYCLSTGVSMALIHTQVHPRKLPLSFFFLGVAVLLAFACIMSLKELLQKIILIVSHHDDLDDLEAPAAQPQPSATTTAAARNLDWAKIIVVYCLSTGVTMALIRTQVDPSKL